MSTLLKKIRCLRTDKVPAGHLTKAQWARKWNLKLSRAGDMLRLAVPKLMGMKRHRIETRTGAVRSIPHYYER